jgi:hypothetical protein
VNALAPPKKARGELVSKTARKLIASTQYAALSVLANLFGALFWFIEQRRWRLADLFDNERSMQ